MNLELVWFIMPTIIILWQLGGTFNKLFRRLGFPIVASCAPLFYLGWSWWWPLLFGLCFLVTTLPFTLKGDGINEHWFNWIWIWILGYLYGLPSIVIGLCGGHTALALLVALTPCIATGIVGTLSNVPATSKYFPWKECEGVIGFFTAIPYALLIQLAK